MRNDGPGRGGPTVKEVRIQQAGGVGRECTGQEARSGARGTWRIPEDLPLAVSKSLLLRKASNVTLHAVRGGFSILPVLSCPRPDQL